MLILLIIMNEIGFSVDFVQYNQQKSNYPKYVVSMTPFMDASKYEGIIHLPLKEFLKNNI